jgi:hypothetical protein
VATFVCWISNAISFKNGVFPSPGWVKEEERANAEG